MSRAPFRPLRVALAVSAMALGGCYSKATGYDGKLTFAYEATVGIDNFVKPIAPGAKLDVHAFENGTLQKLRLVKATSSAPGVVVIEAVKERTLVLRGIRPGVADVTLTAKDEAGHELVDRMFFHVAKPATQPLEHMCTRDESEAAYAKGDDVYLFHRLATADKRPVIGYGVVPLAIEPKDGLVLVEHPQAAGFYHFRADVARPHVKVRSTVDDSALDVRVFERGEPSAAKLYAPERVLEGETDYLSAHVSLPEDVVVCSQNALTRVKTLTPDICSVTARLDDEPGEDDENHAQLARVKGLKLGVCEVEMSLPELAGGRGVTLRAKIDVGRVEVPRRDSRAELGLALAAFQAGFVGHAAQGGLALASVLAWRRWARRRRR